MVIHFWKMINHDAAIFFIFFIGRETIGCAEKLVPSRPVMILLDFWGFWSIQFWLVIGLDSANNEISNVRFICNPPCFRFFSLSTGPSRPAQFPDNISQKGWPFNPYISALPREIADDSDEKIPILNRCVWMYRLGKSVVVPYTLT